MLTLELHSPTLPAGRSIVINLSDGAHLDEIKRNPINIKEGVEYKCVLSTEAIVTVLYLTVVVVAQRTYHLQDQPLHRYRTYQL